jgi:hypothetical protein
MASLRQAKEVVAASWGAEQTQNKRERIGGFGWTLHSLTRCSEEVMAAG